MDDRYLDLIHSARVAPQTRDLLVERSRPDLESGQPSSLGDLDFDALRGVLARVLPQKQIPGRTPIDLAIRVDQMIAKGKGDGWRYASLPRDGEALQIGLSLLNEFARRLEGVSFDRLAPESQDGLIDGIAFGRITSSRLDLQRWFEDLRAFATQIYVSHPETLAQMNYSGIADDSGGFVQIGIGRVEPWEPIGE